MREDGWADFLQIMSSISFGQKDNQSLLSFNFLLWALTSSTISSWSPGPSGQPWNELEPPSTRTQAGMNHLALLWLARCGGGMECVYALSSPVVSNSVRLHRLQPARLFCPCGISQARTLEQVAISFSRGSSWLRDWTCVPYASNTGRWVLYLLSH